MTSCIDNEEPESIEAMRKAQANKIQAEADKIVATTPAAVALAEATAAKEAEAAAQAKLTTLTQQLAYDIKVSSKDIDIQKAIVNAQAELDAAKVKAEAAIANAQAAVNAAKEALSKSESSLATQEASTAKNVLAQNVEILLAAAKLQDPVNGSSNDLKAAYQKFNAAADSVVIAQYDLVEAQEAYVVALGSASRDSIANVVTKATAVLTAEQAVTAKEKAVDYAKAALATAKAQKELGDQADWVKVYNEQNAVIESLRGDSVDLAYAVVLATKAKADASTAYTNAKDELDKALKAYKSAAKFYNFKTDNENVKEELAKAYKNSSSVFGTDFAYAEGVISNSKEIANSDLETKTKPLINYLNGKIYSSAKLTELAQIVAELTAQTENYKTTYTTDKAAFDAAVKAFDDAAIAFEWSKEAGKSLKYEAMVADLTEAKTAIAKAYGSADLSSSDESKKTAAETALKDAVNAFGTKLAAYNKLRLAFDGFKTNASGNYSVTVDGKTTNETLKFSEITGNNNVAMAKCIAGVLGSGYVDTYFLGTSYPQSYDAKLGYGLLVAKGQKLMGSAYQSYYSVDASGALVTTSDDLKYPRMVELTAEEIEDIYENDVKKNTTSLKGYGSQGLYNYALLFVADKAIEVANQNDWVALYNSVVKEVEDVKANIAAETAKAQASYVQLQDEVDALAAATANEAALTLEKTSINTLISNAQAFQAEALKLSKLQKKDIEAYNEYLKYEFVTLEQAVETAEAAVLTAEAAVAKAEAEYKAYLAGTLTNETAVHTAQKNLELKQLAYDVAKAKYDLAKAAYETALAAVKKAAATVE